MVRKAARHLGSNSGRQETFEPRSNPARPQTRFVAPHSRGGEAVIRRIAQIDQAVERCCGRAARPEPVLRRRVLQQWSCFGLPEVFKGKLCFQFTSWHQVRHHQIPNRFTIRVCSEQSKQQRRIGDIDVVAPRTQLHCQQLFDRWAVNPDATTFEEQHPATLPGQITLGSIVEPSIGQSSSLATTSAN